MGLLASAVPTLGLADELDRPRFRFEVGAGTETSNEMFFEDSFVDTTFLGRRLVGTPETRWAALGSLTFEGRRDAGLVRYRLQQDASVGDRLQRGSFSGTVQGPVGVASTWHLAPRLEYRRDQTFGRDVTQWRGDLGARLRRTSDDGAVSSDLGVRTELSHATGSGSEYLPDHWVGRVHAAVEGLPLSGPEWRAGYALASRTFPDSSGRDHLEHAWESRVRLVAPAGHSLGLEVEGERRTTVGGAPTSRDRFLEGRGALAAVLRFGDTWSLAAQGELEVTRYDDQDSSLYFDYRVVRARLGPRVEHGGWSLTAGPRGEVLSAALAPAEDYREIAAFADLELLPGGAWWSISPAGGWRDYDLVSAPDLPVLHSSYGFAEAAVLADQPLPGRLRLRASGLIRLEWHEDRSQDARSLYFSLELRRLL